MRKISIVTALILAAGCATAPPSRFFTLDMRPSGGVGEGIAFEAHRFSVAEALSGREMLIQTSPTEIEYYAAAQWVAGLDELVAEKFSAEFSAGQGAAKTVKFGAEIQHFEQVETGGTVEAYARLYVIGSVEDAGGRSPFEKTYSARVAIAPGSGLSGLAEGLSRCVEQIAVEIAADAAGI